MSDVASSGKPASPLQSTKSYSRLTILAWVWLGVSLIVLRILLWPVHSVDLDAAFLPWQDTLIAHGRLYVLRRPISDYFPAYFELTLLTSFLDGFLSRVAQIKIIPLCCDLVGAFCSFTLVKYLQRSDLSLPQGIKPRIAAVFVILAGPTVILNSAAWGQTDMLYTALLVLTVYLVCVGRGATASLTYGIALAFKLQSVFLAPFYIAMLLRRRIPPWSLVLLPAGWMAALLPIALAGGSPRAFLGLPMVQTKEFRSLSTGAENMWQIANVLHFPYGAGVAIGIALGAVATGLIVIAARRIEGENKYGIAALAALSLFTIPYVLPKMHDRYFFAAEILLAILTCVDLTFLLPTALLTSASLIAYLGYFQGGLYRPPKIVGLVASTLALLMVASHFFEISRRGPRDVSS
jgi:Gpi18-like mannosyltransferase